MGKGKAWSRDDQVITVPLNKDPVSASLFANPLSPFSTE